MVKKIIGAVVVVLLVAGAGFWWFVLRDDAPEELSVDSRSEDGASTPTGSTPESFDGTWAVVTGGDTQAGFRIQEDFAGGVVDHEAVGRTPAVEGSITIAGTTVSEGSFTVDLTSLEFTDSPPGVSAANRANAMKSKGLETDTFPEATFALTSPIELEAIPEDGETTTAEATGDLTLHGVTRSVTFTVEAKVEGDTIRVASADPVPVVLADHEIEEPTAPFVASVSDEGSFEFLLVLQAE
jgi:polyisoprenoid-binding protein YceI